MKFTEQGVRGCFLIDPEPFIDERGTFSRVFSRSDFENHGLEVEVQQLNVASTAAPGTVRGIHWQTGPAAESKVVVCAVGKAYDVCVDVRPDSATFGSWVGAVLSPNSGMALYVPPGCGHGYMTLEPGTVMVYSSSKSYQPSAERGLRWDDRVIGIEWPLHEDLTVSTKDRNWPDFDEA